MVSYLILCRSLTYAQRTARVLERSGISCYIVRTPRSAAREGCGYSVKLYEKWLEKALVILKREGLSPSRVFMMREDEIVGEASL